MALILNIDTTTNVCSAALAQDGKTIDIRESDEQHHSQLLGVYVDELLKKHKINASDLSAVAVSMGPGSYTGLRIGVSLAKGLCFGADIPLIAVDTLRGLALSVAEQTERNSLLCPMLDARRMEVYTAMYQRNGDNVFHTRAEIITPESFAAYINSQPVYFMGNGSDKIHDILTPHANVHFIPGIKTSAAYMAPLAEKLFQENKFEDVAYFEPFYLKDFIATTPKHKVL